MSALLENETVFIVRVSPFVPDRPVREVIEARVIAPRRHGLSDPYFSWVEKGWPDSAAGHGERFFSDEGVTWARPENKNALEVVVALT